MPQSIDHPLAFLTGPTVVSVFIRFSFGKVRQQTNQNGTATASLYLGFFVQRRGASTLFRESTACVTAVRVPKAGISSELSNFSRNLGHQNGAAILLGFRQMRYCLLPTI
jgi:hypothetical protein